MGRNSARPWTRPSRMDENKDKGFKPPVVQSVTFSIPWPGGKFQSYFRSGPEKAAGSRPAPPVRFPMTVLFHGGVLHAQQRASRLVHGLQSGPGRRLLRLFLAVSGAGADGGAVQTDLRQEGLVVVRALLPHHVVGEDLVRLALDQLLQGGLVVPAALLPAPPPSPRPAAAGGSGRRPRRSRRPGTRRQTPPPWRPPGWKSVPGRRRPPRPCPASNTLPGPAGGPPRTGSARTPEPPGCGSGLPPAASGCWQNRNSAVTKPSTESPQELQPLVAPDAGGPVLVGVRAVVQRLLQQGRIPKAVIKSFFPVPAFVSLPKGGPASRGACPHVIRSVWRPHSSPRRPRS